MIKIIDAHEFSHFLRVHRNSIIETWLAKSEVQNVFHKHSLPFVEKHTHLFHEFCDCYINVIQQGSTIHDCQAKMGFLELLNNYHVSMSEFFTLITRIKSSLLEILFKDGNVSFNLQEEIETVTLQMANEFAIAFEVIIDRHSNFKNENSNLLTEYKRAVDLSNIVSKTNPKGVITYVNDKFCEISGYSREELIGKPHNIIRHPEMPREAFKDLWDTIKAKRSWHGIVKNMKKSGGQYIVDTTVVPILDVDGDVLEYIAIRHDITELEETKEQLKNLNKAMKYKVDELYSLTNTLERKASKDHLTGAMNRESFEDIFQLELKIAKENKSPLSLILFDLDYFKLVNDTYGHQAGDNVLIDISNIVINNIKANDIFARWGGEEFVLLLPRTNLNGAIHLAENLRRLVEVHNFSHTNKVTASFGIAELESYESKESLFQKADDALYLAKKHGRNRVETYNALSCPLS